MTHHPEDIFQLLSHIIEILSDTVQNHGSRPIHRLIIDLVTERHFGDHVVEFMIEVDYVHMD